MDAVLATPSAHSYHAHDLTFLNSLAEQGDYDQFIEELRRLLADDPSLFAHSYIKQWCGRRWRNLFLTEALNDTVALKKSDRSKIIGRKDKRSDRQKLAEQFLRGDEIREWKQALPEFQMPSKALKTTLVFSPVY